MLVEKEIDTSKKRESNNVMLHWNQTCSESNPGLSDSLLLTLEWKYQLFKEYIGRYEKGRIKN